MKRTTQIPFELKISNEASATSGKLFFISGIKVLLFAFSAFCVSITALAQSTGMGCNAGYQAEFPNYANFGHSTLIAFPIRIPSEGTLDSLAITHKFAGGNVVLALYQNNNGAPGALVAASVAGSLTFQGTQRLDVPDTFVPEGDYFVALIYSEAAMISYPALAASGMTTAYYKSNSYSMGFPQSFGPATSSSHLRINVWAIINCCPLLLASPSNVTVVNSVCTSSCTINGGSITGLPGQPCPLGSFIQYQENGGTWTSHPPVYDQDGPPQTIKTRCVCELDHSKTSPESAPVTTIPGQCNDNQNPTISCPANITVNATSGACSAVVTYTTPTATDNCSGVSVSRTAGLASGASFPVGTTTVTHTATDAAGNTASCSFTVTVRDNENPTISCPANITVNATSGACSAVVTYTTPTATDNCSGVSVSRTAGLASGASFPVGTTTVTHTATDAAGNTASCSFTVTVRDNENPTISCPANITVNATSGACSAVVTYTTPTATDNCSGVSVSRTAGLASGASFPVGTTTVTHTATDAAGNTASCSFTVTVRDNEKPTISCPANITVNATSGSCSAVVTYTTPTATDNCSGVSVSRTAGLASGASFPVGTTTVTHTATDAAGNTASCSFTVTVRDNENPTISCPANITVNATSGACSAVVTYTTPTATDNCSGVSVSRTAGLASGASFPVGTTTVTHTATDAAGNTASCSFTVTVRDNEKPTISCPANITVNATSGSCSAVVTYTTPTASDNCSGVSVIRTAGLASGASFPVGTTTVTHTATDAAGNTASCSFTVTVRDNENPTISCPANITVNATSGACSAVVTYTTPTATDNCSGVSVIRTAGLASGASFPVGTTTLTHTATDASGNTASCSFTVTVRDNENPIISCPANITVNATSGACSAVVTYTTPTATDNCSGVSVSRTAGLASGASFPVGTTTVTHTATDAAGNTASCSFTVTVRDNERPTVFCVNRTVIFNGQSSIALHADSLASAFDNCGIASISISPRQVFSYQVGQIVPVTVTATDIYGNVATCISDITVRGLPEGWSNNPNGVGCDNDCNESEYNPQTGVWTSTSTGCYYGPPYNADEAGFVQRALCGNGSITVQVVSLLGQGWAGVVMRESNAPGSKKVQLTTNLSTFNRREFRIANNGAAYPQQFSANQRFWLRIVRSGQQFSLYVSTNGQAWHFSGSQNVAMDNCILMGLVTTGYTSSGVVTANFANVSFTGNNVPVVSPPDHSDMEATLNPLGVEVFPNPGSGEFHINLSGFAGQAVRIEWYGSEGRLLGSMDLDKYHNSSAQFDISRFPNGLYWVQIQSEGQPDITRKVLKQ